MAITGSKAGTFQMSANVGGLSAGTLVNLGNASASPNWGIVAAAALAGTITTGTVTLGASATFAGTEKVGVFWIAGGVAYQRLGCTIASGTGTSFAITGGSGTSLPSGGQAVLIATGQDITDGVSIPGSNLVQLLAKSSQPGAVEWIDAVPAVQRTSTIAAAQGFDTWPTTSPSGAVPFSTTVTTLRCYNNSLTAATIEVGVLLT